MAGEGLDALLLVNSRNLLFLSGYPQLEGTLARPFYLVVPRTGEPVLIVHEGRAAEARRYSWVTDVRAYRPLSVAPVELIAGSIRGGGAGMLVGAELGYEQRIGIPIVELDRIRDALTPARLVDAAALLWQLRMVKSPADIRAIRQACRVTAGAYAQTFAATAGGDVDHDVARRMTNAMSDAGGNAPWVLITSGPGAYELATGVPVGRALEPGDMVWMDAGCSVESFWSDYSRAAVVGTPAPDQVEAQRRILDITATAVGMVRPGVPVREIAAWCNERVRDVGLPVRSWTSHLAGRVGHGIGYDVTEPPHVSESDPTVLVPGMVISIEPGVATDAGLFHAEQNVLVTEDGAEILSASPSELRTLPIG
jgi:Xaa-Pro aminopeptidase